MGNIGKRFKAALGSVDRTKKVSADEALELVIKTATAKFDETVEVAVRLGVDPKQSELVKGCYY